MSDFKQLERIEKNKSKKDKVKNQIAYHKDKDALRVKRKLKNQISNLEKKIQALEKTQNKLDKQLADPSQFQELSKEEGIFERYEQNQQKLAKMERDWEKAIEKLELIEC